MNNDLFGNNYTIEQIEKLNRMNSRESGTLKPNEAFYRKSMGEVGPTWSDKRKLVTYLINDSNISASSKVYLQECEEWIPKY